jgi:chromosome segregation ATPase
MYVRIICLYAISAVLPLLSVAAAQPYQGGRQQPTEDPLRQVRTTISDLKNDVRNHESEIRTFEAKLLNQEASLETIRQQLFDDVQEAKDQLRTTSGNLEGRVQSLDNSIKGAIADLKQLHTQSNDSVNVLSQYKAKLSELEQIVTAQNEHMKHLEAALKSMMELLQGKETAAKEISSIRNSDGMVTYKVQSGDSLEKIARVNKVSIKALKEANHLTSDKITVGQTLKIP